MSRTLHWRQVNCNPAIFKTRGRPPYNVPSEQTSSWTKKEVKFYKNCKGDGDLTKEDYRQFLIDLNAEFDMEGAFNQIELGVQAFEKLVACTKQFPNYDLNKNTEEMYVDKENFIYRDFIKCGVDFIKNYEVNFNDTEVKVKVIDLEEKLAVENGKSEPDEKRDFSAKSKGMEEDATNHNVKEELEVIGTPLTSNVDHLSQVDNRTPTAETTLNSENAVRKKKKRNKERRQERLLKFHQKLVKTSGLPPSRLMEQKSSLDLIKRNLKDEFEHLGSTDLTSATVVSAPAVPLPVAPVYVQAPPPVVPSADSPPGVQSNGSSSSTHILPMLCSITPSWTGGYVGVTSTPGWPDARPLGGLDSNMSQSSHQYFGSSSGSPNHSSLSSSPQYGMGLPVPLLFQSQPNPAVPAPPVGRPAYCFHCLQYGSVYAIYPV